MMMVIEDSFYLGKGTVVLDRKDAPWAASDAVMVDQLHELLRDVYSSAEEIEASQIEPMNLENLDECVLEQLLGPSASPVELANAKMPEVESVAASESSHVHAVSAAASRSLNAAARPKQRVDSRSRLSLDPEMLNMIKTREILAALRDAGFFIGRKKGPHINMTDKFGRIVPVPRRLEQKRGTVYRMYELATAPLKKKANKPFRR